jgi:hypothetical protein
VAVYVGSVGVDVLTAGFSGVLTLAGVEAELHLSRSTVSPTPSRATSRGWRRNSIRSAIGCGGLPGRPRPGVAAAEHLRGAEILAHLWTGLSGADAAAAAGPRADARDATVLRPEGGNGVLRRVGDVFDVSEAHVRKITAQQLAVSLEGHA